MRCSLIHLSISASLSGAIFASRSASHRRSSSSRVKAVKSISAVSGPGTLGGGAASLLSSFGVLAGLLTGGGDACVCGGDSASLISSTDNACDGAGGSSLKCTTPSLSTHLYTVCCARAASEYQNIMATTATTRAWLRIDGHPKPGLVVVEWSNNFIDFSLVAIRRSAYSRLPRGFIFVRMSAFGRKQRSR